jgi:putative phage-type endonuclease
MIAQGSPEWFAQRLGRVTASRVADVVARTKSGWGASRANYMAQIIAERLTGIAAESYTNAAMQWGTDNEAYARSAYEFYQDSAVAEAGFIEHPSIAMSGASPDGFVGNNGLVEIKCPNTATHIDTLLGGSVADKYIVQMLWQMACTGRAWCDFVSFDPRMPEEHRLFVRRVSRDEDRIAELEKEVRVFLTEIDGKIKALTDRTSPVKHALEQSLAVAV